MYFVSLNNLLKKEKRIFPLIWRHTGRYTLWRVLGLQLVYIRYCNDSFRGIKKNYLRRISAAALTDGLGGALRPQTCKTYDWLTDTGKKAILKKLFLRILSHANQPEQLIFFSNSQLSSLELWTYDHKVIGSNPRMTKRPQLSSLARPLNINCSDV